MSKRKTSPKKLNISPSTATGGRGNAVAVGLFVVCSHAQNRSHRQLLGPIPPKEQVHEARILISTWFSKRRSMRRVPEDKRGRVLQAILRATKVMG